MAVNPIGIFFLVLAVLFIIAIGITIFIILRNRNPSQPPTPSGPPGPRPPGPPGPPGPNPASNRIINSGVTCGGTDSSLLQQCGTNLICSPSGRICVVPNNLANNPTRCGPNNPCNINYVCGDNNLCLPAFIADPNRRYIIRSIVNRTNPLAFNVLQATTATNPRDPPFVDLGQADWGRLTEQRWQILYVPQGNYYAIINANFAPNNNTMTIDKDIEGNDILVLAGENWTQLENQRFNIVPVATQSGTYAIVNLAQNLALSYSTSRIGIAGSNWDRDINQRFIISQVNI